MEIRKRHNWPSVHIAAERIHAGSKPAGGTTKVVPFLAGITPESSGGPVAMITASSILFSAGAAAGSVTIFYDSPVVFEVYHQSSSTVSQ